MTSLHPRRFVRDSLATALSQYLARAAVLVRGVVALAALGPAGYGAWNALNLLLDYGSYASCGALQGLDRDLPPAVARDDRARARRVMAGAWAVVVAGGLLFTLAALAYLASGHRGIEIPWGSGPPLLMVAAALLQLAIHYHAGALRAHGEFQRVSAAQAVQAVMGGGLGVALVVPLGVWGLLAGWLAGSLAALAWLRAGPVRPPLLPGAWGEGRRLAAMGLPIFAFFSATLVMRSVDRIAFVRHVGVEGLGHYGLGLMAAGLILYLPESAAAVLFPRMAAAAQGARPAERTQAEVTQIQRALAVTLPPGVALGMVWAGPLVGAFLPAFREGVPALRWLAWGALMLSAATLPGYFLLAGGPRGRLLGLAALGALVSAVLVFSVATRDPRPGAIAMAAAAGYALFSLGLVAFALPRLCASTLEGARLAAASFVPALWAGALAQAACAAGPAESPGAAALRSAAVAVGYLPVLWWFGRGAGLGRLVREWWAGRVAP